MHDKHKLLNNCIVLHVCVVCGSIFEVTKLCLPGIAIIHVCMCVTLNFEVFLKMAKRRHDMRYIVPAGLRIIVRCSR